jgi:hypothetical protein
MLEGYRPHDRVRTSRLMTHCSPRNRALEMACSLGRNQNLEDLARDAIALAERVRSDVRYSGSRRSSSNDATR